MDSLNIMKIEEHISKDNDDHKIIREFYFVLSQNHSNLEALV